jgi:hypothetical protein
MIALECPYPCAVHEDGERLIAPWEPLRPGEWFEVQLTAVRLEDAGRLIWQWRQGWNGPAGMEAGGRGRP